MDSRERQTIEELFDKIARVEGRSAPRDLEAEAFIRWKIAANPAAAYYMAQTIVVQEQALNEAARRIEELEREFGEAPAAGGGLFGGLFSSAPQRGRGYDAPMRRPAAAGPWGGGGPGMGGGGFLAGAAQTAMGVAGGVVLGNMIADWISPDTASTADAGGLAGVEGAEQQVADAGDFGGGDFDVGDF